MKRFLTVAAFAAAAFILTPAHAQVSTDSPNAKPLYVCKAKPGKGKAVYTGRSRKSLGHAKTNALRACRIARGAKGCKIDSCIG
jgi:hypothetical protein